MYIPRLLTKSITDKLVNYKKGIILYGARQVGKTTLINEVIKKLKYKAFIINGDQNRYIDIISKRDVEQIRSLIHGYELLFIDEAQRIPEIGLALKIVIDTIPEIKVLVTGSSSLDLASKISEPLTGRVWTYRLYPISFKEMTHSKTVGELDTDIEDRLIYGSYPDIFSIPSIKDRKEFLYDLCNAYLYKDLIEFGGIKNSRKIRDLLKLIAFQTGSLVSLSELGSSLGMSKDTVSRYIDLLEKSFVIFRLPGFSRNLRKETVKMDKIFFYDLGIRNALIDNLNQLNSRNDIGQLWENYLIYERIKLQEYTQQFGSRYFWRTYTGAELDYVEEREGKLFGYEFSWKNQKTKPPATWLTTYKQSTYECVTKSTYTKFIT